MTGIDYIVNNQGSGSVAERLLANNGDCKALRRYIGKDGRCRQDFFIGNDEKTGKPVYQSRVIANATATLRKEEWVSLDKAIVRAARPQLKIWQDLEAEGLGTTVPEGMGKTVLQYQSMSDAGNAQLDMDGVAEGERDRVTFDLRGLPLPIAHADFSFTLREIMQSRNFGMPIDTTMAEQSTHKVVELVEKLTLGTLSSYSYAGYTVYGFRNYPYRITKTFTLPTTPGWTPDVLINELLDALQALNDLFLGGPFALYVSPGWSKYLDADYSAAFNGGTLRTRIGMVTDIKYLRKLDYLPNYEMVIVQMNSNTVRAVTGMQVVPLQWETNGGLKINFKIMCIKVPMLRANQQLNTGIVHCVAA